MLAGGWSAPSGIHFSHMVDKYKSWAREERQGCVI